MVTIRVAQQNVCRC